MSEELTMNYNSINEIMPKQQIMYLMQYLSNQVINLRVTRFDIDRENPIMATIYILNNMLDMEHNKFDITIKKNIGLAFFKWVIDEQKRIVEKLKKKSMWIENVMVDVC
jgi:hypothetical protein